jgi:hypothetical protein
MIDCTQNEDGTFTISWDENDPQESIFNNWKEEEDFINAITNYLNSLKESGEVDDNIEENLTESIEQITEFFNTEHEERDQRDFDQAYENYIQASYEVSPYYIDQTAEEVTQDIKTARQYIQETNKELYGDQGSEQSQT